MKIRKQILFLFLCSFLLLAGCGFGGSSQVKKAIAEELDLLKKQDSRTVQKYVSYTDLFPYAVQDAQASPDTEEVFSLFFRNFDYKIKDVEVDKSSGTATAAVRFTTMDARALAKDFAAAKMKRDILSAAGSPDSMEASAGSLESSYLLLDELLKNGSYESADTDCTMKLRKNEEEDWEIVRNQTLENQMAGGLLTYLSDPDILSPEETIGIYLDTLVQMDEDTMSAFLGMDDLVNSDDTEQRAIASAVVEQIKKNFSYKIKDTTASGYQAQVTVDCTTFDLDAIKEAHKASLEEYLASPDAVIDGSAKRQQKSLDLLLDTIRSNTATITNTITIPLTNNGLAWKIEMDDSGLGSALFGNPGEELTAGSSAGMDSTDISFGSYLDIPQY